MLVVKCNLKMSYYFLTKQLLQNLRDELLVSIICYLSVELPLDYGSSRIWPMPLLPHWILWFLCAPYIPILLTNSERRGAFPFCQCKKVKKHFKKLIARPSRFAHALCWQKGTKEPENAVETRSVPDSSKMDKGAYGSWMQLNFTICLFTACS